MGKLPPFIASILQKRTDPNKDDFNHAKLKNWYKWKQLQRKAFKRDKFLCQRCKKDFKSEKQKLTIDHVIKASDDKTKWFDLDNLRTLCKECHRHINAVNDQNA